MKNNLLQLLITLMILLSSKMLLAQTTYVINDTNVSVRDKPTLKGKILGTIPIGETVIVTDKNNLEWYYISYFGNEGYILSKYLLKLEDAEKYKDWEKQHASTGDNPACDNISPQYNYDIDNELLIKVGNKSDAVVKLMNSADNCIRIAFIQAGDRFSMKHIPEGIYYLKIAYGKDFRKYTSNGKCIVKFMVDAVYKKSSQNLNYYKSKQPTTIEGDYEVSHWNIPSFDLELNVEYTKDSFKTFQASKTTELDFNR